MQPQSSLVHLVELDQDIRWDEENISLDMITPRPGILLLLQVLIQGGILAGTVQLGGSRRIRLRACGLVGINCSISGWKRQVRCVQRQVRRCTLLFGGSYLHPALAYLPTLSPQVHEDDGSGDVDMGPQSPPHPRHWYAYNKINNNFINSILLYSTIYIM